MDGDVTRILLVDEQRVVRAGLRHMLRDRQDLEIACEASDQAEALHRVTASRPDLVLTELRTPRFDATILMREARARVPSVRFLVVSGLDKPECVSEAVRAGASAYVLKTAGRDEVLAAVDAVRAGGVYLAPSLAGPVAALVGPDGVRSPHPQPLSQRQKQVLTLVAEGYSTREISESLGLTERTVESHRYALMKKLRLSRVAQLVRYAIRENMVAP